MMQDRTFRGQSADGVWHGAADVPKQAYAQAMAGYMMKNLLGG